MTKEIMIQEGSSYLHYSQNWDRGVTTEVNSAEVTSEVGDCFTDWSRTHERALSTPQFMITLGHQLQKVRTNHVP